MTQPNGRIIPKAGSIGSSMGNRRNHAMKVFDIDWSAISMEDSSDSAHLEKRLTFSLRS
jgi:hypothetical protein